MKMFRLNGKIAIVTGGAGYFGKPISAALAEAGAQVIIGSRDKKNFQSYADDLKSKGWQAEGMLLDLSNEISIEKFVKKVHQKFGSVDILVNNAVTRQGMKDLENLNKADIENTQLVNTTGLMMLTKHVVKIMRQQKSGNIINISSIQGTVGPNFPVYGNTGMSSPVNYTYEKWGMVGFTKWLANYYGKFNIRANCISPGGYGPGIVKDKAKEEFIENYKRLTPLGRFAGDDDIKGPVIFLASEASSFITGQNLMVDGGWTNW